MQQLSGLDTSFIHLESSTTPMHIGSLAIYDQSTAPGGKVTFKDILAFFESRLDRAPVFRQRLANVPMGLDNPYWIEDANFDLEFHVRHIALPQPGDWRQLCIQAARLHSRPLDMRKPLWEAYVIEGLDNVTGVPPGAFGLVTKFHHAAIDGVSGAEIAMAIHDLGPQAVPREATSDWQPDRVPTDLELLGRSAINNLSIPVKFGKLLYRTAPTLRKLFSSMAGKEVTAPTRAPRTRFNSNVGPHRVFDGRSFPLSELKIMRTAVEGATLNDVVVAICGGAMRKYLMSKDELPERSLVAMAPMSVRSKDQAGSAGNQVTALSLPIRTDIEDPIERLAAVHGESQSAKQFTAAAGSNLGVDLANLIPAPAGNLIGRLYGSASLAEKLPPMYNTVITNVPGANVPIYSMGSQMVTNFGLGPCVHGVGLFQPVLSYNGQLTISAVACRDMMPDPAFYCQCLEESFAELQAAVGATQKKPAKASNKSDAKPAKKKPARKKVAKQPSA